MIAIAKTMGWAALKALQLPFRTTPALWKASGAMLSHPLRTVAVGSAAYAGWQALANDKPVSESLGTLARQGVETIAGKDVAHEVTGTIHEAQTAVADTLGQVKDTLGETRQAIGGVKEAVGGLGTFMQNMSGGNAMGMIGNFLGNLTSGRIGGMGVLGMIAAGYLLFGRSGILGKIGGLLMAMMLIGANSQNQSQSQQNAQSQQQQAPRGIHR